MSRSLRRLFVSDPLLWQSCVVGADEQTVAQAGRTLPVGVLLLGKEAPGRVPRGR